MRLFATIALGALVGGCASAPATPDASLVPPPADAQPVDAPAADAPAADAAPADAPPPVSDAPPIAPVAAPAAAQVAPAPVAAPAPAPVVATPAGDAYAAQGAFADAVNRLNSGDVPGARSAFERAAAADPGLVAPRINLGIIAERQGRAEEALQAYKGALQAKPDSGPAARALSNAIIRTQGIEKAISEISGHLARHETAMPIRNELNRLYVIDKQYDRAVRDSKAILRLDERNVGARINLATSYYQLGKFELARFVLKDAAEMSPADPLIQHKLGFVHLALEARQPAIGAFTKAVELDPGFAEARNNLGVLYHEAGDYQGALAQFTTALATYPRYDEALLNAGNAYRGMRKFDEAETSYKKAIELDRKVAPAWYNLGILYLDAKKDGADLAKQYQQAVDAFNEYKSIVGASLDRDDPVDKYIGEAAKRIEVEQQKKAQVAEQQREVLKQAEDDKAAAEAEAEAAEAAKAEAAAAPPAEPGAEAVEASPDAPDAPDAPEDAPAADAVEEDNTPFVPFGTTEDDK